MVTEPARGWQLGSRRHERPCPLPDTSDQGAADHDVLIVGAGISGISMAAHLKMLSPDRDFAIVEQRDRLGGTWDLFRYPGVRSDSDMHSLGFRFEPWVHDKSIADGDAILAYLDKVVDERGIRRRISFGTAVLAANWISRRGAVEGAARDRRRAARGHRAGALSRLGLLRLRPSRTIRRFRGARTSPGAVVHPQFWPRDLDYAGKRVVVIGSGATAVTIVPAMAETAAHVTMLQRTPTWIGRGPPGRWIANCLRKLLPGKLAYRLTRAKNIGLHFAVASSACARGPRKPRHSSPGRRRRRSGRRGPDEDFVPPYNPWEQRLCLVPDGDLFEAVRAGRASVATGAVERFEKGRHPPRPRASLSRPT